VPEHAEQQRAKAEKARRLASGMTDPALVATLQTYAAECEAAAARLETETSDFRHSGKQNGA
jgi:hypothetical protein